MVKLLSVFLYAVISVLSSCDDQHHTTAAPADFIRYRTDLTMQSSILGESVKYAVYLPGDYTEDAAKTYSVVFLLHGYGCDHNDWNDEYLNITSLISSKELAGDIQGMIYVMPQGFNTYYVNKYDGSFDYMDMFTEEFVPFIDKVYRTKADRKHRAIVGFSMGGYGAMILPSKHPELFSVSVPLSMSYRTDEQYMTESANGWDTQWGAIFGGIGLSGEARLTDYYKDHCPFYYFNAQTAAAFANVDFFIDCGDDEEQLLVGNDLLHRRMRDLGIAHEYRVSNGAHTSSYWRNAMREVLTYIGCRFSGEIYPKEENVEADDTYIGAVVTEDIDGIPARVFKSASYDESLVNTAIYFIHDGWKQSDVNKAMNLLNVNNANNRFIVVSVEQGAIGNVLPAFAEKIKTKYHITCQMGIGIGRGGEILYEASVFQTPAISSLFLFDAKLHAGMATPYAETFYYIDITDMGTNYNCAGELYLQCRENEIEYEYRVRNGIDSTVSFLKGILLAKSTIMNRIKNY